MNTKAFALIKDLELALPLYQQARTEFERITKQSEKLGPASGLLARQRELALGEVVVRVNDVLATIKRHEAALG